MNIVLVSPTRLPGPKSIALANGVTVWLRSHRSELLSLPIDVLVFMPGVSEEIRQIAISKTQCIPDSEIFDLVPVTR
jgi:hypothetical protein